MRTVQVASLFALLILAASAADTTFSLSGFLNTADAKLAGYQSQATAAFNTAQQKTDAAQATVASQSAQLQSQTAQLQEQIKALQTKAAEKGINLQSQAAELSEKVQDLQNKLVSGGAKVTETVDQLQAKSQAFKSEIEEITKELRELSSDIAKEVNNQTPNAHLAVAALQEAYKNLNSVAEKAKSFQKEVEEKIKSVPVVAPTNDKIQDVINKVSRFSTQGGLVSDTVNGYSTQYQTLLDGSVSAIGKGFNSLSTITQGFADNVGNSLPPGKARDKIKSILANVNTNVQKASKKVGEFANKATSFISNATSKVQDFSKKAKDIFTKVQNSLPKVKETASKVKDTVNKVKDAFSNIKNIFNNKGSSNTNNANGGNAATNAISQITGLFGQTSAAGKDAISQITGLFGQLSGSANGNANTAGAQISVTVTRKCTTGTCCDVSSGQFKAAGTACFPSKHPCEQAAGLCDGQSATCVKQFKADGTVCPGGTCVQGQCQLAACESDCCQSSGVAVVDGETCSLGKCLKGFCVPEDAYTK